MGKLKFEAGRGRFLEIQETVSITEVQVDTANYPEDLGKRVKIFSIARTALYCKMMPSRTSIQLKFEARDFENRLPLLLGADAAGDQVEASAH